MPDAPDPIQEAVAWLRKRAATFGGLTAHDYTRWADAIEAREREIGRLREALRVNLLRHVPGATHAEIDALLGGKETALGDDSYKDVRPLTNTAFAALAARLAQKTSAWAADTLFIVQQGADEPFSRHAVDRYLNEMRSLLNHIDRQVKIAADASQTDARPSPNEVANNVKS